MNPEDLHVMISDVKSYTLLADVYQGSAQMEQVEQALQAAKTLQLQVLEKVRNADQKRDQLDVASSLCFQLAEHYKQIKQLEKAKEFYDEALEYKKNHEPSRLALARLYLSTADLEQCLTQCQSLLKIDPNHREASTMLADLKFKMNESESALSYFQQMLDKNPTQYSALTKLVTLLRRAGRIDEAPKFIKQSEKATPERVAPGLWYCKGLVAWYLNDPREANNCFNQARKDPEWGKMSLYSMIEIYLNPDNNDLFQEETEAKGDSSEGIANAEILLKELAAIGETGPKYVVLEAYTLMASKQKPKIEKALNELMKVAVQDSDYVPGVLGIANALVLLGQPPKARNQLKRIAKMKVNPDYYNEFERSWLMLADMYIQAGKFDMAQQLCRQCLSNNQSCAKAWELLGFIFEKESSYKDAADHYESAWKFMNQANPAIGYKLAFNYLKAKRYVEAIDVCHKVLAVYKDYPKIRKDILDKARLSLRA